MTAFGVLASGRIGTKLFFELFMYSGSAPIPAPPPIARITPYILEINNVLTFLFLGIKSKIQLTSGIEGSTSWPKAIILCLDNSLTSFGMPNFSMYSGEE